MRPPKKPRLDVTSGSDGDRSLNGAIPVVGIGSSAGGIEALRSLIPEIQRDSGLAYVIVQHLDPDHASKLTELLGRVSKIPVAEIESETRIESNCIYVLPPNAAVTIENDRLLLTGPVQPHGYRTPIDGFLVSLAESKSELAACVILSGTGSDGTLGLRAIKEHGGFTLAQDGAQYDGMMRSALSTGLVDFVLPAAEISAKLTGYFRHVGDAGHNGQAASALADHVPEICRLLRARTGHDFSGYKDKTIIRRVQRRMQVLQIESAEDFVALLRKRPQELDALLQDLLIGVTNFFRDPAAFELLERDVIPKLFLGKGPDDSVRVWIPGCSTGEEAYSIAILLKEYAAERPIKPKLQVFASDIDEHSLQIARMGRYPAAIAKDVSPRRLDRHFVREDGTYRISTELREICLFSQHNLLRDAPFSKLDLVSCRNLLIYLTGELQNRLIPLFHYALNTGGFLFLGSSENVTRHTRLFETEDKTHRIFQRRHLIERRLPEFPLTAPERARLPALQTGRAVAEQETLQGLAERQLLERYAPPYVVINGEGELIHASTRTGKYLELAAGVPKTDIFGMARRGLRAELRAGVHKAAATGTPVVQPNVAIGTNGGRQNINLIVHPIRSGDGQSPLFMVVFQDAGPLQAMREEGEPAALEEIESSTIQQLETELRSIKDRLQTTTEELESSNEELKSGNEELSSMNEELQSANEELETSKEELQSINEELQTVNSELNARVEELSRANSDIANLLESTQIATVFLDRDLSVKSFTPAAKDVFRLVESDTGRPITHVRARFASDTLQADAERVLRTLGTIERQVESTHNGARYVMRILPYRTVNNVISGVVITFTDVSKISAAEARIDVLVGDLRERMQNLETLIDLVPVGILFMEDSRSGTVKVNHTGARLLGETVETPGLSPVRANWQMIENGHPLPPDEQPVQRALRTGEPVPSFEGELIRADGSRVPVLLSATPLLGEDGKSRGAIAAILDISQRKRDQAQQQVLLHELQHRVKNVITTIGALATRMMKSSTSLNEFATAFSGRLSAMARTHELLNSSNWTGAGLRPLIDNAIRSYAAPDNGNISISGPDVMLAPSAASTLGLVLYELASNAVKYGALREGAGQVKIIWDLVKQDSGSAVDLRWTERDGPPIAAAIHDGFGSSFIKRSVEYELGGKVILEFHASGLECRIQFPVRRNVLGNAGQSKDSTDAGSKPLAG